MKFLERFRTSRGFGVHSPFAFNFITEVLRQPCRHYALDSLEAFRGRASRKERSVAALIYRVALFYQGEPLDIIGTPTRLHTYALTLAGKRVDEGKPQASIVIDMKRWKESTARMESGMSFDCKHCGVIVHDPRLPLQHFRLRTLPAKKR